MATRRPQLPGWMKTIDTFTPARSTAMGVALSAINPKNLLLTVGAAAAIAQTGASASSQAVALAVFIVIATLGVGAPVVIYFVMGDRGGNILGGLHDWMARENATIMAVICLIIGAKLIGDAITALCGLRRQGTMTHDEMVEIPPGTFTMGSERFYPEEQPVRAVSVDGFAIDRGPVTVGQFARFVGADRLRDPRRAGAGPRGVSGGRPCPPGGGSAVFHPTPQPVPLDDPGRWWAYVPGADWRHPWGPRAATPTARIIR